MNINEFYADLAKYCGNIEWTITRRIRSGRDLIRVKNSNICPIIKLANQKCDKNFNQLYIDESIRCLGLSQDDSTEIILAADGLKSGDKEVKATLIEILKPVRLEDTEF